MQCVLLQYLRNPALAGINVYSRLRWIQRIRQHRQTAVLWSTATVTRYYPYFRAELAEEGNTNGDHHRYRARRSILRAPLWVDPILQ